MKKVKVGDLVKWTPNFTRSPGKYNVGLVINKVEPFDLAGQKRLVVLWEGMQKGFIHKAEDLEVINESQ